MPNYRVIVQYDSARSVFVARAPEIPHTSGEGATRTDAIAGLEEEIAAQLANSREKGGSMPSAIDEDDATLSGDLVAKVSRGLHRDLAFQARAEGLELGPFVGELLAQGLEARRQQRRRPSAQAPAEEGRAAGGGPGPGQGQGSDRRPPFRGGGGGSRYHAIMEDRASFLEYVRGLESGAQPPRGRDRRRGGGRGPGGAGSGGAGPGSGPGDEGGGG